MNSDSLRPAANAVDSGRGDHFVQFYEHDDFLVQSIADFLGTGLRQGEAAIAIATPAHRAAIEKLLAFQNLDLDRARISGRYTVLDAAGRLSQFLVNGRPDRGLFAEAVGKVIQKAIRDHGKLRAFGEMVALLWASGNPEAALELERLWNDFRTDNRFSLFCGYSLEGFNTVAGGKQFERVCDQHTKVFPAESFPARGNEEDRLRGIAELQQKALALETEVGRRERATQELRATEERLAADLRAMTRLYELGNHCARTGESFEQCLERILETALLMTQTTKGFIQIPDSALGHLKIVAHRGFSESVLRLFERGEEGESVDWPPSAPMGERVVIADVTKCEHFAGQPVLALLLAADVRALQFTPLRSSTGQLLGAISTHFEQPHQPEERELRLLDLVARQAADYLERKRAEERLRKRGEQLLLLSDTLAQLLSASDPDTIVRELFRKVAAHLDVDTYFNFMVNPAGDALALHSCAGIAKDSERDIQRLEFGQAICGTVAQTGLPIHATDIQNSTYDKANLVRGFGIQCYACNPLIVGGNLLGTLSFASRSRPAFEEEELQFLRIISQHTAIALERLRSAGQLEKAVQERTASLRDAIDQMEEFNYTVSHDLRAPLRGMQAFSEALLQDYAALLPDEGKHFLTRIAANAMRLDKMILDILSLTRHARAELRIERIDLGRLVRQIVELYPAMQSPVAQVDIQSLHPVRGHEPSLNQAISNLLNNAVKFVAPGVRPVVQVRTELLGRRVRLWIADNGIGVNPKYQHRLFGIFERVHTDLNYDGTGVGLAIVRKTVERMGGKVGMESDGISGSRFWIELEGGN